ncbi:hypothetical protein N9L29_05045, partial [Litoricolaceae bacterium]|nr:hypothetical protein [Litorivicinaceae bacterium]
EGTPANFVGTAFDDVLFNYQLDTIIYGGDGNDHIGSVAPWYRYTEGEEPLAQYIGGDGADTFYIPISAYMPSVEIVDFKPGEGDSIQLVPYEINNQLTEYFVNDGQIHLDFQWGTGEYVEVERPGGGISASRHTDGFMGTQYFNVGAADAPAAGVLVFEQSDGVGMSIVSFTNSFATLGDAVTDYVANNNLGTGNWFVASASQITELQNPSSEYFIGSDNGLWTWDLVTRYPSSTWEYIDDVLAPITILSDVKDIDLLQSVSITDSLDELGIEANSYGNQYWSDPVSIVFGTRGNDDFYDTYHYSPDFDQWFFVNGGHDSVDGGAGSDVVFVDAEFGNLSYIPETRNFDIVKLYAYYDSDIVIETDLTVAYEIAPLSDQMGLYSNTLSNLIRAAIQEDYPGSSVSLSWNSGSSSDLSNSSSYGNVSFSYSIDGGMNSSASSYMPTHTDLVSAVQSIYDAFTVIDSTLTMASSPELDDSAEFGVDSQALISLGIDQVSLAVREVGDTSGDYSWISYSTPKYVNSLADLAEHGYDDHPGGYGDGYRTSSQQPSISSVELYAYYDSDIVIETDLTVAYEIAPLSDQMGLYSNTLSNLIRAAIQEDYPGSSVSLSWNSGSSSDLSNSSSYGNVSFSYSIDGGMNSSASSYMPTHTDLVSAVQSIYDAFTVIDSTLTMASSPELDDSAEFGVDSQALISLGIDQVSLAVREVGDTSGDYSWISYSTPKYVNSLADLAEHGYDDHPGGYGDGYHTANYQTASEQTYTVYLPQEQPKSPTEFALEYLGQSISPDVPYTFVGNFDPNGSEYEFKSSLYVGVDINGMGAKASQSTGWGTTTYGDIHWIMPDHGQGDTSQYATIQQAIDAGVTFRIGHKYEYDYIGDSGWAGPAYGLLAAAIELESQGLLELLPYGDGQLYPIPNYWTIQNEVNAALDSQGGIVISDTDSLDLTRVEYIHFNDGTFAVNSDGSFSEVTATDLSDVWRLDLDGDSYLNELEVESFRMSDGWLIYNFTDEVQTTALPFNVEANTVVLSNGVHQAIPDFGIQDDGAIDFEGGFANEIVIFGGDRDYYHVDWSAGSDYFIGDERAENSIGFEGYRDAVQNIPNSDPTSTNGIYLDNSGDSFVVETDFGTTSGYGFNKFRDSHLDDVFVGGDSDEQFKFELGGSDSVSAGLGRDYFRLDASHATSALDVTILDYENFEIISLEDMGFDSTKLDQQITVSSRLVEGEDYTFVSVATDTYTQADLLTLVGAYDVADINYREDGDVELSLFDSNDPAGVLLSQISFESDANTYYSGTYNRVLAEFRDLPNALIGPNSEGVALNYSSSAVTLSDGTVLASESGLLLDQMVAMEDYDSWFDKSLLHYYSFRGSEGDDFVVTDEIVSTI